VKYKIMTSYTLINEKQLEKLAIKGWELIAIISRDVLDPYHFYFKKIFPVSL
jgi:hypothetical protein